MLVLMLMSWIYLFCLLFYLVLMLMLSVVKTRLQIDLMHDMDTIEQATFRYDTAEVEHELNV